MVKPNSHNIIITVLRLTNAIMSCPLTLYSAIDCSFVWLLIWKYCMGPQFIPEPFSSITTHTLVGDHAKISGKAPVMLKVYYNITGVSYQIEVIIYVWQLATKCSYMQNLVVRKRSKASSTWVVRQWAVQPSSPPSANRKTTWALDRRSEEWFGSSSPAREAVPGCPRNPQNFGPWVCHV